MVEKIFLVWFRGVASNEILGGPMGKISLIYPGGATPSSLSQTLERLFELTERLQGPMFDSCVKSGTAENQGHYQVFHARRVGPRALPRTTDANLEYSFRYSKSWESPGAPTLRPPWIKHCCFMIKTW